MADYDEILNRSWDDIQEDKLLPVGSWLLKISNISYQKGQGDKDPVVLAVFNPKEPMTDVDDDQINELGSDYDYTQNRLFKRFYISGDADWKGVKRVLELAGVEVKGKSIIDAFKEAKGREVVGYLEQSNYEDKATGETRTSNEIKKFAKAE